MLLKVFEGSGVCSLYTRLLSTVKCVVQTCPTNTAQSTHQRDPQHLLTPDPRHLLTPDPQHLSTPDPQRAQDVFGSSLGQWSRAMQRRMQRKQFDQQNHIVNYSPQQNQPTSFPPDLDSLIRAINIPNVRLTEEPSVVRSAEAIYPRSSVVGTPSAGVGTPSAGLEMFPNDLLIDSHGRRHQYLRLSLTDRCNLRCQYCMPNGDVEFSPTAALMTPNEIAILVGIFIRLGVNKIRLTGGEPTFRPEFSEIVSTAVPNDAPVRVYAMTTNGILLGRYFDVIEKAGVNQVTLSLDSLIPSTFESICQRRGLKVVWKTIGELVEKNFCLVKINCVLMRGINDQELFNFVKLTERLPIHIRFIEFMPFDRNKWAPDIVVPKHEILFRLTSHFGSSIKSLGRNLKSDVAEMYQIDGYEGCFGVISPVSDVFCKDCDRISPDESPSLRHLLQNEDEALDLISKMIKRKKAKLGGSDSADELFAQAHLNRPMTRIGG